MGGNSIVAFWLDLTLLNVVLFPSWWRTWRWRWSLARRQCAHTCTKKNFKNRHGKIRSNSVVAEANPMLSQVLQFEGCSGTFCSQKLYCNFQPTFIRSFQFDFVLLFCGHLNSSSLSLACSVPAANLVMGSNCSGFSSLKGLLSLVSSDCSPTRWHCLGLLVCTCWSFGLIVRVRNYMWYSNWGLAAAAVALWNAG